MEKKQEKEKKKNEEKKLNFELKYQISNKKLQSFFTFNFTTYMVQLYTKIK